MKINADVNAKNWLTKEHMIKDFLGIQVIVNVNLINHVLLEEYADYKNCKCRKKSVDKLVEECNKNIDEEEIHLNQMICNSTLNDYEKNIIKNVIFFIISVSISSVFIYFYWYLKTKYVETTIYWMQFCWTYKWEILSRLILKNVHITFLMIW